jgi:hypothetical protein
MGNDDPAMRNLLYDKTYKKWLADIQNKLERLFGSANVKIYIVTISAGKNGALASPTVGLIGYFCSPPTECSEIMGVNLGRLVGIGDKYLKTYMNSLLVRGTDSVNSFK